MKAIKAKKDPVVPDQSGRMMPADPLGINASPKEVKRRFDLNSSREEVIRQRAYAGFRELRGTVERFDLFEERGIEGQRNPWLARGLRVAIVQP